MQQPVMSAERQTDCCRGSTIWRLGSSSVRKVGVPNLYKRSGEVNPFGQSTYMSDLQFCKGFVCLDSVLTYSDGRCSSTLIYSNFSVHKDLHTMNNQTYFRFEKADWNYFFLMQICLLCCFTFKKRINQCFMKNPWNSDFQFLCSLGTELRV